MKSDLPYLGHINDAIAAIEAYVADGRETFLRERMIQDAVIRNFEVIGGPRTACLRRYAIPPALPGSGSSLSEIASFTAIGAWISCSSGTSSRKTCLV